MAAAQITTAADVDVDLILLYGLFFCFSAAAATMTDAAAETVFSAVTQAAEAAADVTALSGLSCFSAAAAEILSAKLT